jgi:hypothetical protein
MVATAVTPKSPFLPLLQRRNFLQCSSNPSLEKRGEGEIFGRNVAAIMQTDFRYTTLARYFIITGDPSLSFRPKGEIFLRLVWFSSVGGLSALLCKAIDFPQQRRHRRPIGRILALMGEENISLAIEHKVAAGLMDVLLAVILPLHSFTEKFHIAQ